MLSHTLLYLPIYARASRHKLLGIERILIGIIILRDESKKNWNIVWTWFKLQFLASDKILSYFTVRTNVKLIQNFSTQTLLEMILSGLYYQRLYYQAIAHPLTDIISRPRRICFGSGTALRAIVRTAWFISTNIFTWLGVWINWQLLSYKAGSITWFLLLNLVKSGEHHSSTAIVKPTAWRLSSTG